MFASKRSDVRQWLFQGGAKRALAPPSTLIPQESKQILIIQILFNYFVVLVYQMYQRARKEFFGNWSFLPLKISVKGTIQQRKSLKTILNIFQFCGFSLPLQEFLWPPAMQDAQLMGLLELGLFKSYMFSNNCKLILFSLFELTLFFEVIYYPNYEKSFLGYTK
eukprot:TRINITY_DN25107_c0_g1_i2.p2 TRINITY_DN25107_c0_g1~~TRINITY_DN25107_c0_g1_i2.p2  ORF type:complete len:164 (-),score=4.44 TRINITY_DN25107_c0_g1_i2:197-688(-)